MSVCLQMQVHTDLPCGKPSKSARYIDDFTLSVAQDNKLQI